MEFIRIDEFMQHLFDRELVASRAGEIVAGILAGRSPRLSDVAQHMPGTPAANYKAIQRFIGSVDMKAALRRLFQSEAEFVIGDPTEMPRPQAYKTAHVGKLSDGETRGHWLLVLATPFRARSPKGRARAICTTGKPLPTSKPCSATNRWSSTGTSATWICCSTVSPPTSTL